MFNLDLALTGLTFLPGEVMTLKLQKCYENQMKKTKVVRNAIPSQALLCASDNIRQFIPGCCLFNFHKPEWVVET